MSDKSPYLIFKMSFCQRQNKVIFEDNYAVECQGNKSKNEKKYDKV